MEVINPALVPQKKLNTDIEMPIIGMGTFGSDRFTPEQVSAAVSGAIRCGYHMFNCAVWKDIHDHVEESWIFEKPDCYQ